MSGSQINQIISLNQLIFLKPRAGFENIVNLLLGYNCNMKILLLKVFTPEKKFIFKISDVLNDVIHFPSDVK